MIEIMDGLFIVQNGEHGRFYFVGRIPICLSCGRDEHHAHRFPSFETELQAIEFFEARTGKKDLGSCPDFLGLVSSVPKQLTKA